MASFKDAHDLWTWAQARAYALKPQQIRKIFGRLRGDESDDEVSELLDRAECHQPNTVEVYRGNEPAIRRRTNKPGTARALECGGPLDRRLEGLEFDEVD